MSCVYKHTEGDLKSDLHNCEYVELRNAVIPVAEARANKAVPDPNGPNYNDRWSKHFLNEMALLTGVMQSRKEIH